MTVIDFPTRHLEDNSDLELLPHQEQEVEFLKATPRAFLLSETGTGKTPSLLTYAEWVMREERRDVLWVTEAGLIDQLRSEVEKWLHRSAPRPVKLANFASRSIFTVTTHQWLAKNRKQLIGESFGLVVVDEADAVQSGGTDPDAKVFRGVQMAAGRADRSVLATATPITSLHGLDLYALLAAGFAPGLLPREYFQTLVKWVEYDNGYGFGRPHPVGLRPQGHKHLARVLARSAIATGLEHVGAKVPYVRRGVHPVSLTDEQQASYETSRRRERGLARHRSLTKASMCVDALSGAVIGSIGGYRMGGHTHIMVFAEHFDLLNAIARRLETAGIQHWTITGRESLSARSQAAKAHSQCSFGVLLGTRAIETGLNLQHCSVLISAVSTWSNSREAQREGRICRVGSEFDTVHHTIVTPDTDLELEKLRRVGRKNDLHVSLMEHVPCPWTWAAERGLFA